MNHRTAWAVAHFVALASSVVACSDYSAPDGSAGAPGTAGGSTATGGSAAAGAGTGGSASGAAPVGGSAGAGGSPGTGGAAGAGGSAGAGGRETPPEASCENVTACGGDATGVWFATSSCLPVSGMADLTGQGIGCKAAPITGKLAVTGNLTLGADGMFSDNTSTTGEVVLELAPECLDVSGTVTMCDRIGAPLSSVGYSDVKCVDSTVTTGGCTCTGTVKQAGSMGWVAFDPPKTGTHTSANNVLTLKNSMQELQYSYCVEGNFMKATPSTKTIVGTVSGTVVLQKQPQ
jgi:hypothetical protein